MCRLFGLKANIPVNINFSMCTGPKPFQELAEHNPDGWGMGWYDHGDAQIVKEPLCASDHRAMLSEQAISVYSDLFLCHVRMATVGELTVNNCHPFQYNNWLFAHNGSIHRPSLLGHLAVPYKNSLTGETDSEVYFHWIMQCIETAGDDVVAGVRLALQSVQSRSGLNFVMSDGQRLYAYRDAVANRDYYTLYFLERHNDAGGTPLHLYSSLTKAMLESKSLYCERAVLVCSERLTHEDWKAIGIGTMLIVAPNLSCQLIQIRCA